MYDRHGLPLSKLAREAIQIQDASNLRGVLLAWHKALCQDAVVRGGAVEEFLNVLYLSKVTSLLHATTDSLGTVVIDDGQFDGTSSPTDFRMAYEWAKSVAD